MKRSAFTLLEIIIVIIIIGVLTSLALPRMFAMVKASEGVEAVQAIATIKAAMERYALMNDGMYYAVLKDGLFGYVLCPEPAPGFCLSPRDDTNALDIGNPNNAPGAKFEYTILAYTDTSAGGKNYYFVTAQRKGGELNYVIGMVHGDDMTCSSFLSGINLQNSSGGVQEHWCAGEAYKSVVPKN